MDLFAIVELRDTKSPLVQYFTDWLKETTSTRCFSLDFQCFIRISNFYFFNKWHFYLIWSVFISNFHIFSDDEISAHVNLCKEARALSDEVSVLTEPNLRFNFESFASLNLANCIISNRQLPQQYRIVEGSPAICSNHFPTERRSFRNFLLSIDKTHCRNGSVGNVWRIFRSTESNGSEYIRSTTWKRISGQYEWNRVGL